MIYPAWWGDESDEGGFSNVDDKLLNGNVKPPKNTF